MKKSNLYIIDHTYLCRDILYIDGTKYEAYANKMTFVWRKATDKFYANNWVKAINAIQKLNKYFKSHNLDIRYGILKQPSFEYLLKITDKMEDYATHIKLQFVHGKGKRKTEFQRIYDNLAECAIRYNGWIYHGYYNQHRCE